MFFDLLRIVILTVEIISKGLGIALRLAYSGEVDANAN